MQIINNPPNSAWSSLLKRPALDATRLESQVRSVLENVQRNGDAALKKYTLDFDGVDLDVIRVAEEEILQARERVPEKLVTAIRAAASNIRRFHEAQLKKEDLIETQPGISCWRTSVGIDRVGLYIPGGTAPLFSTVLMLGIPAQIAGCRKVILCTPPSKEGSIHPAILVAAEVAGIREIYKAGGAQAIAAMAYGTESIPRVHKIFGPGNQYVTCAKQLVQMQGVAIDMPAGPSEVCVLADETAKPAWIAADLLSQAEHGADSQVMLITTDAALPARVNDALEEQLAKLPRNSIAVKSLASSKAIVVDNLEKAIELANEYAAEHLIVVCKNLDVVKAGVRNAGSVFLGPFSPESVGDYASGTNHTLPTNGFARAYSGVSTDSFVKKITWQHLTEQGLNSIAETVVTMATAEGLEAHAEAVRIRLSETTIK